MKAGIHPNYVQATVTCACGNTFTTRSTRDEIRTDLCNVCHPFYTGEQRIVDTAGQVERFMRRFEAAQAQERRGSKRQQRLQARAAQIEEQERKQQEAEARERAAGGQADLAPANAETTDADAGETAAEA